MHRNRRRRFRSRESMAWSRSAGRFLTRRNFYMSNRENPTNLLATDAAMSRRHFLWQAGGLGGIALAWMLNREAGARESASPAISRAPHFPPRAKRVLQIFCM